MKIFGIGVDIIENKRFKKLLNNKTFINRICSSKEYRVLKKKRNIIFERFKVIISKKKTNII